MAAEYNCKVYYSISCYTVEQVGECSKERFGECLEKLQGFLRSVNIEEVKMLADARDRRKFIKSPYIHESKNSFM